MTNSLWHTQIIELPAFSRGFHLITSEVVSQLEVLKGIRVGLLHLFLQHTSASLSVNENADPTVRMDMEAFFNRCVRENEPYYEHTYEGPDDMPAHIKSSILGCEITLPIYQGRLQLGTWQGIYLGEHRNHAGSRRIAATIQGGTN